MSPLLRDRVHAVLHGDGLTLVRLRRFPRLQLVDKVIIPYTLGHRGDWRGALAALDQALAAAQWQRTDVTVVLASDFVRFQVVPWSPQIHTRDEEQAYLGLLFRAVHGDVVESWSLRRSVPSYGSASIACAVDRELLDALEQTVTRSGSRLYSVQPYLMPAFNRCRPLLPPENCWFVVVERGRACICLIEKRSWKSICVQAFDENSVVDTLSTALDRETKLVHGGFSDCNVFLYAPERPDFHLALARAESNWQVQMLKPASGSPGIGALDPQFAIAVGA